MCIISKERIAFCAQLEGTRGEIFTTSPIAFQSQCKRVPNEPIPTYGNSWPQWQSVRWQWETGGVRRNGETAIGGWSATRHVVLRLGAKWSATGVSLMALTELIHSDGAIPSAWKYFLLIYIPQDIPLFVTIFLTFSTTASHCSKNTLARCDSIQLSRMTGTLSNAPLAEI